MAGKSFQELFVRTPIKLRGFGLRSLVHTSPLAFIGGIERSVSAFGGEEGLCRRLEHLVEGDGGEAQWWRHLLDSNTRTGHESRECWDLLQREANECCNYLGRELEGTIAIGPAGVSRYPTGRTEKQADRRARELPGTYRRPLERLDQQVHGTAPGETGALVARLQGFGDLLCLVAGAWGDCSKNLHDLVQRSSRWNTFANILGDQRWRGSSS